MSAIFLLLRYFPFWALPLAWVCVDLGKFYRRRGKKQMRFTWYGVAGLLVVLSVLWVVFQGYARSDQWIKQLFWIS